MGRVKAMPREFIHADDPGTEIDARVAPEPEDIVVRKTRVQSRVTRGGAEPEARPDVSSVRGDRAESGLQTGNTVSEERSRSGSRPIAAIRELRSAAAAFVPGGSG